ncbi:MAG: class I SAM-dependent methyltransferase [Candidatus Promineifilaceae bacterium]
MVRRDLHQDNRLSWNAATVAHNSHKRDQAHFFRQGGSTLFPEELELLGDLRGMSLLHLQCNAGQDTLSLATLGAETVGVDISDEAIEFARRLSADSGVRARFERADVYDWLAAAAGKPTRYDIVFSSYGALIWLSDLGSWAASLSRILKPGGRLVLVEFHPFAMVFDYDWSRRFPYFGQGQVMTWEEGVGDYVAMSGPALAPSGYDEGVQDFNNPHRCHEFAHSIAELLTAVLDAGLAIESWREYPYSNGAKLFQDMVEGPGKRMYPPSQTPNLPLMFGLVARRPNNQAPMPKETP